MEVEAGGSSSCPGPAPTGKASVLAGLGRIRPRLPGGAGLLSCSLSLSPHSCPGCVRMCLAPPWSCRATSTVALCSATVLSTACALLRQPFSSSSPCSWSVCVAARTPGLQSRMGEGGAPPATWILLQGFPPPSPACLPTSPDPTLASQEGTAQRSARFVIPISQMRK